MSIAANPGQDRFVKSLFLVVLACVTLYFGRLVIEPVAFVLFILALVAPFQAAAETRLGKSAAFLLTVVLTLLVLGLLVGAVVWSTGEVVQWSLQNLERFQSLYARTARWLEGYDIFPTEFVSLNKSTLVSLLGAVAGQVRFLVGYSLVVALCLLFALPELDGFKRKLVVLDRNLSGWSVLETSGQIAARIRKYMLIRTVASAATGLAVLIFALLVGLDLPIAWGVIAFVLNYIPYVGTVVATVLPTLFAMAQFESWQTALMIFGGLYLIQFVLGSYLEPLLTGTALAISPFAMLIAFLIWDFLWGMPGSFIGLPVTIALYTLWEQNPSTRWIAALMATSDAANAENQPTPAKSAHPTLDGGAVKVD